MFELSDGFEGIVKTKDCIVSLAPNYYFSNCMRQLLLCSQMSWFPLITGNHSLSLQAEQRASLLQAGPICMYAVIKVHHCCLQWKVNLSKYHLTITWRSLCLCVLKHYIRGTSRSGFLNQLKKIKINNRGKCLFAALSLSLSLGLGYFNDGPSYFTPVPTKRVINSHFNGFSLSVIWRGCLFVYGLE